MTDAQGVLGSRLSFPGRRTTEAWPHLDNRLKQTIRNEFLLLKYPCNHLIDMDYSSPAVQVNPKEDESLAK